MNERDSFPAITVVVSVFNKAEIVEKCVASLLDLDYPDMDILVIEGYSIDGSYELLKKFEDRVRVLRVEGNYATALNRAFDEVRTPLVALTDADCTVDGNWLRELARGFSEADDIVAVAGYVGTGDGLPLLATLTGVEYQERHRNWPKYLTRSPTMNLSFKTDAARRVRFDETLQVAIDTDFGFRLTKTGRMLYNPKAVVYHHPRTSWRSFFKQQAGFARGAFWVYRMHKAQLKGDHISSFTMIWQIPLFCVAFLTLPLGLIAAPLLYISAALFALLLAIYLRDTIRLPIGIRYYPMMVAILFVRTAGWAFGGLSGIASFLSRPSRTAPGDKKW